MIRKTRQVSNRVATVIPEIGFEEDPISPVSREDTVTNRNPNAIISNAPSKLNRRFRCGTIMIMASSRMIPPTTNFIERS